MAMRLTESQLRRIIRQEIRRLVEGDDNGSEMISPDKFNGALKGGGGVIVVREKDKSHSYGNDTFYVIEKEGGKREQFATAGKYGSLERIVGKGWHDKLMKLPDDAKMGMFIERGETANKIKKAAFEIGGDLSGANWTG